MDGIAGALRGKRRGGHPPAIGGDSRFAPADTLAVIVLFDEVMVVPDVVHRYLAPAPVLPPGVEDLIVGLVKKRLVVLVDVLVMHVAEVDEEIGICGRDVVEDGGVRACCRARGRGEAKAVRPRGGGPETADLAVVDPAVELDPEVVGRGGGQRFDAATAAEVFRVGQDDL